MVDFIVTYCKAGLLWFSAFNSSSLLLLLAAVQLMAFCALWRWRWRDYYLPRKYFLCAEDDARVPAAAPLLTARPVKASIVIPCYNSGKVLEEHLPAILEQNFDDYEVIVVDEASTDDTRIVLQRLEARYKHLRHTFVPDSARYVSRAKLAVTLGIRSARSPWVVLTTPDSLPRGNNWLSTLAAHFSDEVDFVWGVLRMAEVGLGVNERFMNACVGNCCFSARRVPGEPSGPIVPIWQYVASGFLPTKGMRIVWHRHMERTNSWLRLYRGKGGHHLPCIQTQWWRRNFQERRPSARSGSAGGRSCVIGVAAGVSFCFGREGLRLPPMSCSCPAYFI